METETRQAADNPKRRQRNARKQLENDASTIGELQADVEDLKTALRASRRNNERLQAELVQHQMNIWYHKCIQT